MRTLLALAMIVAMPALALADEVRITKDIMAVTVDTPEGPVDIVRNQDQEAVIEGAFAKTSRKCPPFCLQALVPEPGVVPVGELEVIEFLRDKKGVLIDARTTDWHLKGTIPGSINIPYTEVSTRLDELGCAKAGSGWDCAGAKEVILYCNGPWCGQSPTAISAMIRDGYPAGKIHYYRGGMQDWKILGLNTVPGSL